MKKQANKSMSFETLCKIWDYQQKETAKSAILPKDRARKTLTQKNNSTNMLNLARE